MFYVFITIILLIAVFSLYFCIKFAIIIIKMQEVIEDSLDIIDEKYNNLSRILEIPIFYNNTEIKSAINEVKETRDALLYIANQLAKDNKALEEEVGDIEDKNKPQKT